MNPNRFFAPNVRAALAVLLTLFSSSAALGQACFAGWARKSSVTVTNAGSPLTDYQVKLTINTASLVSANQMQADGDDIRFALQSDCCTPLCYWIESGMNTSATVIWVKVPNLPVGTTELNLLHGNPAASSGKNGDCTFEFFDDFPSHPLNSTKWTTRGNPNSLSIVGGILNLNGGSGGPYIRSNTTFNNTVVIHSKQSQLLIGGAASGLVTGYAGTDNRYVHNFGNNGMLGTTWDTNLSSGNSYADYYYPGLAVVSVGYDELEVIVRLNSSGQITYEQFCNHSLASCTTATRTFTESSGTAFYLGYGSYSTGPGGLKAEHVFVTKFSATVPTSTMGSSIPWGFTAFDLPATTGFCPGDSVLLDAGSGYTAYTWQNGASTPSIYANTPGTYSVQVSEAGGCQAIDSVDVVVFPLPTPVINYGDTVLCGTFSLPLDGGAYAQYLWQNGDTSRIETATNFGTYWVQVTDNNGCQGRDSMTITQGTIQALPSIVIINPQPACDGDIVVLNAGAGFSSYSWGNSTAQTYLVSQPGSYSVTVTDANQCAGSDTVNVTYYPPINISTSVNGGVISAVPATFVSYQWLRNGLSVFGATGPTLAVAQTDNYAVRVTDANGCTATSPASFVVDNAPQALESFTIYPNPNAGDFRIKLESEALGSEVWLEVHDLQGRLLHRRAIPVNNSTLDVEVKGVLPNPGAYLISLITSEATYRASTVVFD